MILPNVELEVFAAPVLNRCVERELAGIGCRCAAHTELHVPIDDNHTETVRDGHPAELGEEKRTSSAPASATTSCPSSTAPQKMWGHGALSIPFLAGGACA